MQNKRILGITGGVGSGKSTVLQYLKDAHGAHLIELDRVAAQLQMPGQSCYEKIVELFGSCVCLEDASLDRKAIAGIVFADADLLAKLNAIVWPAVKEAVRDDIAHSRAQLIVIEAALLIEDGYDTICDEIWFVRTDPQVRTKRLMSSRGYSRERIENMLRAQKSDEFYLMHTQLVIDNSSDDVENTYRLIDKGLAEHGFLQYCQREQR